MRLHRTSVLAIGFLFSIFHVSVLAQTSSTHGSKLGEIHMENGHLVQHRAHWIHKSDESTSQVSKSSTLSGNFDIALPNGLPRSGAAGFTMEYEIIFTADNATEGIDYFAYNAPSGWTITAIGPAPTQTDCQNDPHTSIISGFSPNSAYWGGDYGGGVVTPGDTTTYPEPGSRSSDQGGCGAFATETTTAAADTHTFSITMTPLASGHCPGSNSGALPLCCTGSEISAGADPPAGSEAYFQEMMAASDGNASVFGDVFYYFSLGCPNPWIDLQKWPQEAGTGQASCDAAFGPNIFPFDTLFVENPPGGMGEFCYGMWNLSDLVWGSETWGYTECDSIRVDDDSLGAVVDAAGFGLLPGETVTALDDSLVAAPAAGQCWDNEAIATCTTPPGSDYVLNVGVQTGQTNTSTPDILIDGLAIDSAAICGTRSLPVELSSLEAVASGDLIVIEWSTSSETDNAGFAVEHRAPGVDHFEQIGFVEGSGTTATPASYKFELSGAEPGAHAFRLKQIDFDGTFEFSGTIEASVEVPGTHVLSAVYPNPFNPQTRFNLVVSRDQHVRVEVFDASGRTVGRLHDAPVAADQRVTFELNSNNLSSGTYLIRVVGDYFADTRQVTLTK